MQNGASVHMTNAEGATALHWAVVRNSLNCIEALLRAGGNKHAKDSRGYQVRTCDSQLLVWWVCDYLRIFMHHDVLKGICHLCLK